MELKEYHLLVVVQWGCLLFGTILPNPDIRQTVPATDRTIPPNPYVTQTVPATDICKT